MTANTKGLKRTPVFTTDAAGREIVLIPLANQAAPACILRWDFDQITFAGYSDQWSLNDSGNGYAYVKLSKAGLPGNKVTIARLLMRPGRRQQVKYHDGNRTNLVRENLYLEVDNRGKKGKAPAAKLAAEAQRLAQRVTRLP